VGISVTGILAYGYIMIEDSSGRSMLGMYRPEVSAQGRRSPSEAMPSPRGSKPCAVRYVHLLYEGRYFSQTSGTGTFCRAGLAARAAYSTRVISLLTVPCYELLEHIRVLPPGRGQRGRLRPPTRASRAKLVLCCYLFALRPWGAAAVGAELVTAG
jgi:hypothetical protein